MLLDVKTTRYLTHRHTTLRKVSHTLTAPWLVATDDQQVRYTDSALVQVLVRKYLKDSKTSIRDLKTRTLGGFFTTKQIAFFIRKVKNKQTSFGVLFLYNLFYWATVANGFSSVFKKKQKGLSNNFSNVSSSSEQNHQSMNRKFNELYPAIKTNELYCMSQPLTTLLLPRNSRRQGRSIRPTWRSMGQKKIVAALLGSYLVKVSGSSALKTYKNTHQKRLEVYKTSKVVYALNQFALNSLTPAT